MVYWTYEQDKIILDESLTDKEKQEMLNKRMYKQRKRYLEELKLSTDKLDKEKQQMIDIYPDYTMGQIQEHLHKPIHYVRTRIHDLKQLGLLREEPIMTKKQKDYIALYASKSKADDLAEDLNLPVNLVKMAVSEEYRKEKIKDKPKKHDPMPKKMRWCEKGRPPQALDKRKIQTKKYKEGKVYEVKWKPKGQGNGSESQYFKGKLLQETKDHITLENKKGIRESFLKVDFYIDKRIQELS